MMLLVITVLNILHIDLQQTAHFTFNENELVNTILINKNSEGTNVENYYDIAERLACE